MGAKGGQHRPLAQYVVRPPRRQSDSSRSRQKQLATALVAELYPYLVVWLLKVEADINL